MALACLALSLPAGLHGQADQREFRHRPRLGPGPLRSRHPQRDRRDPQSRLRLQPEDPDQRHRRFRVGQRALQPLPRARHRDRISDQRRRMWTSRPPCRCSSADRAANRRLHEKPWKWSKPATWSKPIPSPIPTSTARCSISCRSKAQSSSLSSLVTLASPGVSADSNGLFHGLGDHASNSFSVDGEPITDQQSKVFSNQLPSDAVQSMEVIEGAPPAEYGDKTSLVIVVTTRSGLGATQPHGDFTTSFGSFNTYNEAGDFSLRRQILGQFHLPQRHGHRPLSGRPRIHRDARSRQSGKCVRPRGFQAFRGRYHQPQLQLHPLLVSDPQFLRRPGRDRVVRPGLLELLSYSAACNGLGPNGQVVGPQDQRSKIRTYNISPSYTHLVNARTVFTFGGFARQDQYNYYPSRDPFSDLTPDLQTPDRRPEPPPDQPGLAQPTFPTSRARTTSRSASIIRTRILTENDTLGIVDPTAERGVFERRRQLRI